MVVSRHQGLKGIHAVHNKCYGDVCSSPNTFCIQYIHAIKMEGIVGVEEGRRIRLTPLRVWGQEKVFNDH